MSTVPSFADNGTYNLRDLESDVLVGKVHVEVAADDVAGGRGYIIHWALAKSSTGISGWGTYSKPTQSNNRSLKWEGSGESLTTFLNWVASNKNNLRYVMSGMREQDVVP